MYHFFVSKDQLLDGGKKISITGADYNHMANVLRMKEGEEFSVSIRTDEGDAAIPDSVDEFSGYNEYRYGIEQITADEIIGELRFIKESGAELPSKIYLFQGLPKADKMELIIQKAVELGAYQIIPVAMKRSVVKLDEKKAQNKIKRWQAIAESAAKQSKRGIIPNVHMPVTMKEALEIAKDLDVKLLPYEQAEGMEYTRKVISQIKPGESIGIFVGPEGGFDDKEVEAATNTGFKSITMGKRILRTETAGFTMLSWLLYTLER